jgi:hypothetical protein
MPRQGALQNSCDARETKSLRLQLDHPSPSKRLNGRSSLASPKFTPLKRVHKTRFTGRRILEMKGVFIHI